MTDAPSAASAFAMPAPMPFEAPVTSATFFSNLFAMIYSDGLFGQSVLQRCVAMGLLDKDICFKIKETFVSFCPGFRPALWLRKAAGAEGSDLGRLLMSEDPISV